MRRDQRSDEQLAAAAAAGDTIALDRLLERHIDRVHGLCRRVLADPEDARDAAQEALIAIARGIARFDGRSRFTTWLYRVTTNAALDEARRLSRRPRPSDAFPEPADPRAGPDELAGGRLEVDRILATVPPEFRAALALRELEDLDYATIAEVLGIPPGTVRSRIARGRAALADAHGNPGHPDGRPSPGPERTGR